MNIQNKTRVEIKAVLRASDVDKLESWIITETDLHTLHSERINNNIYFETSRYSSATDNIDGLSKRTKVRLRWYGDTENLIDRGKLEFKRKHNNEGWKEKYKINFSDKDIVAYKDIIETISSSLPLNRQIEFSDYNLPFILNRYRRAYYSTRDKKISVTVDKCVEAYDQRWSGNISKKIKIKLPDLVIVEFKFDPSHKPESIKLMKNFPFRVSKHSKYINSVLHSR